MEAKVAYSFNFYFRSPANSWCNISPSSIAMQWDTILTVFGMNLQDAMMQIPEDFEGWSIVKVDYPIGFEIPPLPVNNSSVLKIV
jgi:hypothetical protein